MNKFLKGVLGLSFVAAAGTAVYFLKKTLDKTRDSEAVYIDYYDMLNQWLQNKNTGKSTAQYLKESDFNNISIYGTDEVAMRLYEDLKDSSVCVKYFISDDEEEWGNDIDGVPVIDKYEIDSNEEVDAIIITDIELYDDIEEELFDLDVDKEVISIEDIIYEI